MATIDLKTRDKLKTTMREMAVGDVLRVPGLVTSGLRPPSTPPRDKTR